MQQLKNIIIAEDYGIIKNTDMPYIEKQILAGVKNFSFDLKINYIRPTKKFQPEANTDLVITDLASNYVQLIKKSKKQDENLPVLVIARSCLQYDEDGYERALNAGAYVFHSQGLNPQYDLVKTIEEILKGDKSPGLITFNKPGASEKKITRLEPGFSTGSVKQRNGTRKLKEV